MSLGKLVSVRVGGETKSITATSVTTVKEIVERLAPNDLGLLPYFLIEVCPENPKGFFAFPLKLNGMIFKYFQQLRKSN